MNVDCDVVIVGAGPVGLTSALLLQKMGHIVHIYERHAKQYAQPRAVFLSHQAVRAFSALGLLDRMMETHAYRVSMAALVIW
jgi:2-polyprenyl-6-methoxyphenol hydroxylase-like FAD-dependent oxidoreductase